MSILSFKKKRAPRSARPSWEEIVASMRDEELNLVDGYKLIDIIYSRDSAHRFKIMKVELDAGNSYFTYSFESLKQCDEDELLISSDSYAYWLPHDEGQHIFDDMETLMRELRATPEYISFF